MKISAMDITFVLNLLSMRFTQKCKFVFKFFIENVVRSILTYSHCTADYSSTKIFSKRIT